MRYFTRALIYLGWENLFHVSRIPNILYSQDMAITVVFLTYTITTAKFCLLRNVNNVKMYVLLVIFPQVHELSFHIHLLIASFVCEPGVLRRMFF
jgi:hypothetical protein